MEISDKDFGERIRLLREQAGLSQGALGSRLGIDQSGISRLEDGLRAVTARELVAIGDILGVPLAQLVESDEQKTPALLRAGDADGENVARSLRIFANCIDEFHGVNALAG
jgi:transcriptional regulator with XRE-family HTH domain